LLEVWWDGTVRGDAGGKPDNGCVVDECDDDNDDDGVLLEDPVTDSMGGGWIIWASWVVAVELPPPIPVK
jgi:hypothetical protein